MAVEHPLFSTLFCRLALFARKKAGYTLKLATASSI
jgi:hypothetical protein